jgi:hypothetical protein
LPEPDFGAQKAAGAKPVVPLPPELSQCACPHRPTRHFHTCPTAIAFDERPLSDRPEYELGRRFQGISFQLPNRIRGTLNIDVELDIEGVITEAGAGLPLTHDTPFGLIRRVDDAGAQEAAAPENAAQATCPRCGGLLHDTLKGWVTRRHRQRRLPDARRRSAPLPPLRRRDPRPDQRMRKLRPPAFRGHPLQNGWRRCRRNASPSCRRARPCEPRSWRVTDAASPPSGEHLTAASGIPPSTISSKSPPEGPTPPTTLSPPLPARSLAKGEGQVSGQSQRRPRTRPRTAAR